ncbi:MAG: LptF/LptG family permease [Alphaproteobacteria bacterium]|nr:LptF/LptG family permease [Alphaproteobacteria bacterium]
MRVASVYLSRLFLTRFIACLLGFAGIIQVLDLLNNATDILTRGGGEVGAIGFYAATRLPLVAMQIMPMAALIAALLTLTRVGQTLEIVALKAAGQSYYRTLAGLIPAAAVVAAAHFLIGEVVAPPADRALRLWLEQHPGAGEHASRLWIRHGGEVIAVAGVAPGGAYLNHILLFRRDGENALVERIEARAAEHGAAGWTLLDATAIDTLGQVARSERLPWTTTVMPDDLAGLARPQLAYGLAELDALVAETAIGTRARTFYVAQIHKKFAAPAATLVMILIAAPVARGVRGRQGAAGRTIAGVGIAFLFFVVDGLAQVTAEAGSLPAILAAWSPTALFALVAGSVLLYTEG